MKTIDKNLMFILQHQYDKKIITQSQFIAVIKKLTKK
jgi:hypothetical protein